MAEASFVSIAGSSMIDGYAYDQETEDLNVHFHNGSVYRYHQVPADVVGQFAAASSAGRAFNELIKTRYAWERVS